MKVAMVMPMGHESAIADVMMQAVPHLSSQWDLEVWCPSEANYHTCVVPVRAYSEADDELLDELAAFDLVVYVIGDSPWHTRILPLAQRLPGLVVLVDASLTNLVRRTAIATATLEALVSRVAASVGAEMAETLRDPERAGGDDEWLRFCAEVPLDDVAAEGSLGIVTHSWWHAKRVDGLTLGEVTVAPLPVPTSKMGLIENESATSSLLLRGLPSDAVLLVTVGAANFNRRIDLLLRAIAVDEVLAGRVHLWVVGAATSEARSTLFGLARTLGLQDQFVVTGRVSDALLQEILVRTDIAAALCDPVIEGQSASVLSQLLSATPVVVFDHAHYSELPDDVAVKVDPKDAVAGVQRALRLLVDEESERACRGERSREYVLGSRSGAAYAAALLAAGELALAARPLAHLSAEVRARLRRLDLHQEAAVVEAVTDLAFDLFDLS